MGSNRYRKAAVILALGGGAGLVAPLAMYVLKFHGGLAPNSDAWAYAGEFMAGIAGSIIALATLLALALTLSLQEEELQKTRSALDAQITNAADQLATLRQQLVDARAYESRRIRPVLKAEWFQGPAGDSKQWRIVNVGLGPCVLDSVDIMLDGRNYGSHDFTATSNAESVWTNAIFQTFGEFALSSNLRSDVAVYPIHELKRVLAVGEFQAVINLRFRLVDPNKGVPTAIPWHRLDQRIVPVIHFRSLTGERFNTRTQLDLAPGDPGAPEGQS